MHAPRLTIRLRIALTAVAAAASFGFGRSSAIRRTARATAELELAARRVDSLTARLPADDRRRAAIAWGYLERMRVGLESPFKLVEAASRDPRLGEPERRTVARALLAHLLRGESHEIEPAALDGLGPIDKGVLASGEQHLSLIQSAIARASDPRVAELALRYAYTLAVSERIVDGSAPALVAQAAAMSADGEIARREALDVVRSSGAKGPIETIAKRRASHRFYVERPTLLTPSEGIERDAMALTPSLLRGIREMRTVPRNDAARANRNASFFAQRLFAAGAVVPPSAPLAVTVQRYLPMMRTQAPHVDDDALGRTRNAEMLVAVTDIRNASRAERRAIGRLLLAASAAMRSVAQEAVWFPSDSAPTKSDLIAQFGLGTVTFDHDVPAAWRPYFLKSFADGVTDLRRVLPGLRLDALNVRFRMRAPAESALAMHDPRTRTLHLPVMTSAGTLSHELTHDIDRQSALQAQLAGYRSDIAARGAPQPRRFAASATNGRLAASLRALTAELSEVPTNANSSADRPAEIFATRVDWLVASALARRGRSNGFLSAVQDEMLTGHVVHPDRLRTDSRSRALVTALRAMTSLAPAAGDERDPTLQALLRWAATAPMDRRAAADVMRAEQHPWNAPELLGMSDRACDEDDVAAMTVRRAAESRARGWLRMRARWTADHDRAPWARAILATAPWSSDAAEQRIASLRDFMLHALASSSELPRGLAAYGAPIAARALCSDQ